MRQQLVCFIVLTSETPQNREETRPQNDQRRMHLVLIYSLVIGSLLFTFVLVFMVSFFCCPGLFGISRQEGRAILPVNSHHHVPHQHLEDTYPQHLALSSKQTISIYFHVPTTLEIRSNTRRLKSTNTTKT